jgi:glycosyltransferase involved in cell wall biosynthesis
MLYSIIIPVYNRPNELDELLESIAGQTDSNFEVIVVDDGSTESSEPVVDKYRGAFPVCYFYKPNSGPGGTRNYGAGKSNGEYLLFLDSDCILPERYLETISAELKNDYADFFGGPDKAGDSFTDIQKAISYSMTSLFTTGGIRGGKKSVDKFFPRSFNMGVSRGVFNSVGGFADIRFGEDIDLSLRIVKAGVRSRLLADAWVYHKRRTDLKKFFKQVYNSGIARINLYKRHPESLKLVHTFPAIFTVALCLLPLFMLAAGWYFILPFLAYFALVLVDSSKNSRSIKVGALSILAVFVQLFGYGCGFIFAFWKILILRGAKEAAFRKTFYD